MENTVILDHLTIGYNGKHDNRKVVLSDICATINSGELTCLIGTNGVGKSTLLRTLATFQPKLSGNIFIKGREVATFTTKELATVIGVVLTERPDVANMTTMDMVLMGRSPYTGFWGGYSDEDKRMAHQAIDMMDIGWLENRRVSTLSDGERQKVMIAKALAQDTPIIYLDEPTAFLDYPSKVEIMRLLHRISSQTDKIVFLSTHDLDLALQLADTIWLMDASRGICTGTPEDLALEGTLPQFFEDRGIEFDPATGLFRVKSEMKSRIAITGTTGVRRTMLEKALLRNGIEADDIVKERVIEVKETTFTIIQDGSSTTVRTIKDVLNTLGLGILH